MTRIVAGSAGGRTLAVPPAGTRPTSDRVREAMFSRLDHHGLVQGSVVLDLYAGSGALGLEAASRGAREVVLVEHDRRAAQVCRSNVEALGLRTVSVRQRAVEQYLAVPSGTAVDLAFLDPPYDLTEESLGRVLTALVPHLAEEAVVVLERSARSPEPVLPSSLALWQTRRYGETAVHLLDRVTLQAQDASSAPEAN